MKILLPLVQTKVGKVFVYLLIAFLGNVSYQKIHTPTTDIDLAAQQLDFSLQRAEWTLEYYQEVLNSCYENMRDLVNQKEEYIKIKGEIWYRESLAQLENKIEDYQLELKEYQKNLIDTQQVFKDVHLYPELAKFQKEAMQLGKITNRVQYELKSYPQIYGETEDYNNSLKALQTMVGATDITAKRTVEEVFRDWYREYNQNNT